MQTFHAFDVYHSNVVDNMLTALLYNTYNYVYIQFCRFTITYTGNWFDYQSEFLTTDLNTFWINWIDRMKLGFCSKTLWVNRGEHVER